MGNYEGTIKRTTPAKGAQQIRAVACRNTPYREKFFKTSMQTKTPDLKLKEGMMWLVAHLGFLAPDFMTWRLGLLREDMPEKFIPTKFCFGDIPGPFMEQAWGWHRKFEDYRQHRVDGTVFSEEEASVFGDTSSPRHTCWNLRDELEKEFAQQFAEDLAGLMRDKSTKPEKIVDRNAKINEMLSEIEHYPVPTRSRIEEAIEPLREEFLKSADPGIQFALETIEELISGDVKVKTSRRLRVSLIESYWDMLRKELPKKYTGLIDAIASEVKDLTDNVSYQKKEK